MAAAEISNLLANVNVYQFLKIYQMTGFTRNLSENSDMWNHVKQLSEMDATARSVKYLQIKELGYGAVQAMAADGSGTFPAAQRSALEEPEALYKEWAWTVDVPRVLEGKTGSELMQYAKPLATELDNKQIAFARLKCIELQGDGTGSIGRLNGAASYSANTLTFTINEATAYAGQSFTRWFQEGDLVKVAAPADSTARLAANAGGNRVSVFKVTNIDDDAKTVTVVGYTASDNDTTITGIGTIATTDHIYRTGTTPNSGGISTIAIDYAKVSQVMAGLETLTADDGRTVHGVSQTGAIKGTRKDLNAAVLDSKHFQQLLSELKRKAGKGRYSYDSAFMADEAYDSIVESRETDRRFHSIEDSDRGTKGVGYVHGRDRVEFIPDEFCHAQRIWVLPTGKDALCYLGKDAKQVAPNGSDPMRLSVSSAGYGRNMETNFEQAGVLISKHPRALGVIEDFTTTS